MTLMTLMTLMMPSLPMTLDIHSTTNTSGFRVPSALVNITYIPTLRHDLHHLFRLRYRHLRGRWTK
jgi:hypothetical protein